MSIFKFIGAGVLALGVGVSASSAATLNVVGGQLMGATDVNVGGSLFDVSFIDGTCVALLGGCNDASDFLFTTQADATLASQALLDQVLVDDPLGQFGTAPDAINGVEDVNDAFVLTAFELNGIGSPVSVAAQRSPSTGNGNTPLFSSFAPLSDLTNSSAFVWAVWGESTIVVQPEPVPLPAAGFMMLSGLAAFAGFKRRKKNVG